MTDPQAIADGLTDAQKRALLAMPTDMAFDPKKYSRQISTIAVLRSKRIIRSVADRRFLTPWDESLISRPLGLAVRAILEKQDG